jgi:hypothetical protein
LFCNFKIKHLFMDKEVFNKSEGSFTLWPLVKKTKDFNNVIGGEQKFIRSTFILEANGLRTMPSKIPTWEHFFGEFWSQDLIL